MNQRTKNLISVSGGKDSTATLLTALERDIEFSCVFADTGNEHPDVYDYLEYLEQRLCLCIQRVKADFTKQIARKRAFVATKWREQGVSEDKVLRALAVLEPTGNPFLDLCIWKGRFPSTKAQFCTSELKVLPILEQVIMPLKKQHRKIRSWQGIRRKESKRRSTYPMHKPLEFGVWAYYPLLHWSAQEVFDIHRKHDVKPNPLYKKGMGRVGCMPCINCRKDELSQIYRRFPEVIERLKEWEQLVSEASKRDYATFFASVTHDKNAAQKEISYKTHGIEAACQWSMTERGGVQYDLLKAFESIPSCSSNYGLCELDNEK